MFESSTIVGSFVEDRGKKAVARVSSDATRFEAIASAEARRRGGSQARGRLGDEGGGREKARNGRERWTRRKQNNRPERNCAASGNEGAGGGGGKEGDYEGEKERVEVKERERSIILIASPWLQTASTLC